MALDVHTLFLVTMHVEIMLGLLLFLAWSQNLPKRALAWWGSAHLVRAASIMLFGLHGSVPPSISIDLANAVLFGSFALTWSGARVFDRRPPEIALALVGIAIWMLACRLPAFSASAEARALVSAGIVAGYTWLTAFEFWRGRTEALVSRWPAICMLFAHGSLFLLRTPLGGVLNLGPGHGLVLSGWLELLSLEALLFTISIAFILLAMAKERTEYGHRTAAWTDPLTGIANRRGFLEQAALAQRTAAAEQAGAVLLFDLDHFKLINDRYGHAIGDRALQVFAEIAQARVGTSGIVARWGGDEFVAMLRGADADQVAAMAEQIQTAFAASSTDIDGRPVKATVSTGMVYSANGPFEISALLTRADQALYRAKAGGRNRLSIAPQTEASEPSPVHIASLGRRSAA
jgi:diguanylate cyclase (GGDEF)-like protein